MSRPFLAFIHTRAHARTPNPTGYHLKSKREVAKENLQLAPYVSSAV